MSGWGYQAFSNRSTGTPVLLWLAWKKKGNACSHMDTGGRNCQPPAPILLSFVAAGRQVPGSSSELAPQGKDSINGCRFPASPRGVAQAWARAWVSCWGLSFEDNMK